jgi:HD superfamily phosphohydrolase
VLEIDHESWSCEIIRSPDTEVNETLHRHDIPVESVTALIEKDNRERPPWQKTLLSSELDVDRLDYLRRDSYFTGSGYGHYDWYRILNSFNLHQSAEGFKILVWPDAAVYAIEEYIFSRFYMYNNVYQHKTTRGFEKLVHSAWKRARQIHRSGDAFLVAEIAEFIDADPPTVKQYLAMDDATIIYQMQVWLRHPDRVLSDLAKRFLCRDCLTAIEDPVSETAFNDARNAWERKLKKKIAEQGFESEFYVLRDDLKTTIYNPYIPEKEDLEQDPYNAIFIQSGAGGKPREISTILDRLAAVTGAREKRYRYYVPRESRDSVMTLAASKKG